MIQLSRFVLISVSIAAFASPALAQQVPGQTLGTGSNYETRLEALEDQMRNMNGSIEQLNFGLKRLEQSMQRMQSDSDARLSKLESARRAAAQQPSVTVNPAAAAAPAASSTAASSPADTDNDTDTDADNEPPPAAPVKGTLGAITMQDGKVTGAIVNPHAPPLPQTPPDYGLTPQEQYDRAFDLLRQTDYDDAAQAFKTFIDKNPKDKLVDDAKYWYAETLYVQNKFDAAAVAFADAYQQNPNGSKAPDSLLKMAMALDKLGKTTDACETLNSLKSKYPRAPIKVRQSAEQERSSMKCDAQPSPSPATSTKKK